MRLRPFRITRSCGAVIVQLEVFEEDTGLICSIRKIRGRIDLRPRAWVRAVREELEKLEGIAKAAGCNEMRLGGRKWSRVLSNYEPLAGVKNGLRKALHDG